MLLLLLLQVLVLRLRGVNGDLPVLLAPMICLRFKLGLVLREELLLLLEGEALVTVGQRIDVGGDVPNCGLVGLLRALQQNLLVSPGHDVGSLANLSYSVKRRRLGMRRDLPVALLLYRNLR